MKVLLVEDSERLQRSLSAGLRQQGFTVDQAFDGEQALSFVATGRFDVIVLDLKLPVLDGLSVLKRIRRDRDDTHVLILSANDQTEDRVRGLDLGADDYLVKPFAFDELVSRLRALGRRQSGNKDPVLRIDGVAIDTVARQVSVDGRPLALTPHEYRLLEFLACHRGRVYSHDQLIDRLHDAASCVTRNAIEAHVSTLRKRLRRAGAPELVKTRRGFGYLIE